MAVKCSKCGDEGVLLHEDGSLQDFCDCEKGKQDLKEYNESMNKPMTPEVENEYLEWMDEQERLRLIRDMDEAGW